MTPDRTTWAAEARRAAIEECIAICAAYKARMDAAAAKPHPWRGGKNTIAICKADAANSLAEACRSLLDKEPT